MKQLKIKHKRLLKEFDDEQETVEISSTLQVTFATVTQQSIKKKTLDLVM